MKVSLDSMGLIEAMAKEGNPNSVSDAGVGALCARSAVMGAFLNVKINASGVDDKAFASQMLNEALNIQQEAIRAEENILALVNNIIDKL
jgi:glutamate formiminotransferase/formiminotetrahydrofolate cyclodeaminase